MFSTLKAFISRHRQKFLAGSIVIGGGILLSGFVRKVLREHQEREARVLLERNMKNEHFESVERLCNDTALRIAVRLKCWIQTLCKTELIVERLKTGKENKIELWNELKILSFTKVAVFVYASCLLVVMLRVQMSLIGGYIFRDSREAAERKKIKNKVQDEYLNLCQFYLNNGLPELCETIRRKMETILKNKSLKDKMTAVEIAQVFWTVSSQFSASSTSKDPCKNISHYFIPQKFQNRLTSDRMLDQLVEETVDLLESEEVKTLAANTVSFAFMFIEDKLFEHFRFKPGASAVIQTVNNAVPGPSSLQSLNQVKLRADGNVHIPLAKVIPVIDGFVHTGDSDVSQACIKALIELDFLRRLGANIYEAFSSQ